MCGRFTKQFTWRQLVELYRITEPYLSPLCNMQPRFNFAPLQSDIVIRLDTEGRRQPVMMRWGLVPSWCEDDSGAARCINARAETVAEKPSFRSAFKSRPCLVPASGFYEWKALGNKEKQPYYITLKEAAQFALAGLWEWWRPKAAPEQEPALETFTIITCEPNELCAPIHNRMPVILSPEDWPRWLGTAGERKVLLRPFPAERMECWPVAKTVGNVRNDGPKLIERVAA